MKKTSFSTGFFLIATACTLNSIAQEAKVLPESTNARAEAAGEVMVASSGMGMKSANLAPVAADVLPTGQTKYKPSVPAENGKGPSTRAEQTWRFEGGLRSLHMELSKDKQGEPFNGSFIGSINKLDVDQQYMPVHPYFQALRPVDDILVGVGLSYDQWTVATEDGGGGDGDVEMDAWTVYVIGRMETDTKFSPYAELGWAFYDNSFNPDPTWYAGGRRNFVFDDSTGLHVAAGCDYNMNDQWSFNFYLRYVDVKLDGTYIFRGDSRAPEPFVFPMEHVAYGLGFSYAF